MTLKMRTKNGHEDPDGEKNEQEDLKEALTNNNNAMDPDTMSDTTDKKYGALTRTNMWARKQKHDLPPKLRIHPKINSRRSKIMHSNTMVQTMGRTHLDLREYTRIHAAIHCGPNQHDNMIHNPLTTTIITQYHVSKGLEVFGDTGVSAILKELKQLHDRMVMDPQNADEIKRSKKKAALQYLMFLNQKRCGKIKGRGCADRRKQRKYLTKDDTSAPTVATEALFLEQVPS